MRLFQLLLQLHGLFDCPLVLQLLVLSEWTHQRHAELRLPQMQYFIGLRMRCFLCGLFLLSSPVYLWLFYLVQPSGESWIGIRHGHRATGDCSEGRESASNLKKYKVRVWWSLYFFSCPPSLLIIFSWYSTIIACTIIRPLSIDLSAFLGVIQKGWSW